MAPHHRELTRERQNIYLHMEVRENNNLTSEFRIVLGERPPGFLIATQVHYHYALRATDVLEVLWQTVVRATTSTPDPTNWKTYNIDSKDISPYVLNGETFDIRQHKYHCYAYNNDEYGCACVLVDQNTVLTTERCYVEDTWEIRLGVQNLSNIAAEVNMGKAQIMDISEVISDPVNDDDNGIVVIKLDGNVEITEYVAPVDRLAKSKERWERNDDCTIVGIGDGFEEAQVGNIAILNRDDCEAAEVEYPPGIAAAPNTLICANNANDGITACYDDYGGGMVCEKRGSQVLVGIIYFYGDLDCSGPTFGLKITSFTDFLEDNGVSTGGKKKKN
ncbi:hypothetical protein ScPMuIL_016588 [Solemya velum]